MSASVKAVAGCARRSRVSVARPPRAAIAPLAARCEASGIRRSVARAAAPGAPQSRTIDMLVGRTAALSLGATTSACSVRGTAAVCKAAVIDVEPTAIDAGGDGEGGQKFATAYLKGLRMGPNKVRRVAYAIRGRSYEEALMILEFMPHHACEPMLKLLYSAASNAKNNYGLNKSKLFISELKVDMGKSYKRARIGGRGRIKPYKKFGSHVFIKVEER